jgi:hypothetical protein
MLGLNPDRCENGQIIASEAQGYVGGKWWLMEAGFVILQRKYTFSPGVDDQWRTAALVAGLET